MRIENSFLVPVPVGRAWEILTDVPRIVPCMPGAELTEIVDDRTFRGLARVRIGPVQLAFKGEARIEKMDAAARTAVVSGRGADTKGRGGAQASITFALMPEGTDTKVDVLTDLELTGSVAQYGRGSGLIKEVANQLTGQFAANLRERIVQSDGPVPAGIAAHQGGAQAPISREHAAGPSAPPISAFRLLVGAIRSLLASWALRVFGSRNNS